MSLPIVRAICSLCPDGVGVAISRRRSPGDAEARNSSSAAMEIDFLNDNFDAAETN